VTRAGVKTIDASKDTERHIMRGTLLQRVTQQCTRAHHLAFVKRFETLVNQRLGNPLLLSLGAPRSIDIGARAIVGAIEEQDACPQTDGGFELAREIVIEPGNEKILDSRVVIGA